MEKDIEIHRHHIVPTHMGGMDEPWNIMELTKEEHIIAHLILYKLYGKHDDLRAARLMGARLPAGSVPGPNKGKFGKDHPSYIDGRSFAPDYNKTRIKEWRHRTGFYKKRQERVNGTTNQLSKLHS